MWRECLWCEAEQGDWWWLGMHQCVWCGGRNCLKCQVCLWWLDGHASWFYKICLRAEASRLEVVRFSEEPDSKCLCNPTSRDDSVFILGIGGGKGHLPTPSFSIIPPIISKISLKRFIFHLNPDLWKVTFLHCLSTKSALSLSVVTQLSLALMPCPVLSQLTFKFPSSKTLFYKLT